VQSYKWTATSASIFKVDVSWVKNQMGYTGRSQVVSLTHGKERQDRIWSRPIGTVNRNNGCFQDYNIFVTERKYHGPETAHFIWYSKNPRKHNVFETESVSILQCGGGRQPLGFITS
jgi:hypothetical protein